jgi:replicative DNA helicase
LKNFPIKKANFVSPFSNWEKPQYIMADKEFKRNYKRENSSRMVDNMAIEVGKVPPNAVEIEEAVLGALMLEKDAIFRVVDVLSPDAFYKEAHQHIYQAVMDLSRENEPVDMISVIEKLRKNNTLEKAGGDYYITQLTYRIGSIAHLEHHAKLVAEKYLQRELIRISGEIQRRAFEDSTDVIDLIDFSEQEMYKIAEGNIKKQTNSMGSVIEQALDEIEAASKNTGDLSGIPSGFTDLDRVTSGWQRSDLIIMAARPSMGKTAFVLNMARNMAIANHPVVVFSLEMSSVQLVKRMISTETEIPQEKIKTGKLEDWEWQQLESRLPALSNAPLYVDDTPGLSIFELRAKCRRLHREKGLSLVIIDYLQLMNAAGQSSREQEVSVISRSLKALAKELNVPVIALSQLNRSVTTRQGEKRPMLSDLRESGAIEQDADIVLFIHRPEMLAIDQYEDGTPTEGMADIIIAKHRNGAVADIRLRFEGKYARFVDLDKTGLADIDGIPQNGGTIVGSKMNQDANDASAGHATSADITPNYGFEEGDTPF